MALTMVDIVPDITDEENKIRMESLFNTLCRSHEIKNFNHCEYDGKTKTVHIFIESN